MSDTETPSPNPTPAVEGAGTTTHPHRWRRVAFATALLLTGGVLGAVLHAGAQAWPGDGHGPFGWSGGPGGMRGGPMHGGPGFGGGFFGPSRIEFAVDRALQSVDASSDQRHKITGIVERAADDLLVLRDKHLEGRKQIGEALAAPAIDRARIEALRVEQMRLAETASKRVADAAADAAEVLTPEQRADLARRIELRRRWFR